MSKSIFIVEKARNIPSITSEAERICLAELAAEVPLGGVVLEVGSLYGGTTAILALAAPESASVHTIDDFAWYPEDWDFGPTSPELLNKNLNSVGVSNVSILKGDSREIAKEWKTPIDLLFIDGGHSYEFVHSDLVNFGPYCKVIALHDWDNPIWPTIRQAVEDFLKANNETFYLASTTEMVAVLRRW